MDLLPAVTRHRVRNRTTHEAWEDIWRFSRTDHYQLQIWFETGPFIRARY
jgi:hypothetical protein